MLRKIIVNILFLILSVSSSCYKKIANKTNVKENIQQTKARGILLGNIPYPSFSLPFFFNTNNSVIQPKIFQLELPFAANNTYHVYYTFKIDSYGYPVFLSDQFVSNVSFVNGRALLLLPINFLSYLPDNNYPIIFISMVNVENSQMTEDLHLNFAKFREFTNVFEATGYLNHQTNFTPSFFNTPIQLLLEPNPNLLPSQIAKGKFWNLAMEIIVELNTGIRYNYQVTGASLEAMQNISLNNDDVLLNTVPINIFLNATHDVRSITFNMYWYYIGFAPLAAGMNTTISVKSIVLFPFLQK